MKLFSTGGPRLSAVAKPRLGDTDQRACELLHRRRPPAHKASSSAPTAPFPAWTGSGVEVSRKFAPAGPGRRASPLFSAPRPKQGGRDGRRLGREEGRVASVARKACEGDEREVESNASDTTLERTILLFPAAPPPSLTPSSLREILLSPSSDSLRPPHLRPSTKGARLAL